MCWEVLLCVGVRFRELMGGIYRLGILKILEAMDYKILNVFVEGLLASENGIEVGFSAVSYWA